MFEGAPVLGELTPGTTVEVLMGHLPEMDQRGHGAHLTAHVGSSAAGPDDASCWA